MDSIVVIKVISALLYPLGFVTLCACLALVYHIRGRIFTAKCLLATSLLILLLASNPILANKLVYSLERLNPQLTLDSIGKHDVIIVLGGGLRIPTAPATHVQLARGSDRYWYAARLFQAGKAKHIIISGGNVYQQRGLQAEAFYAAELLQQWGIPESAIEIDLNSRTTAENKKNTADLINQSAIKSAVLVTSAVHMPRAYSLFRKLPIKITPASADVLIRQQNYPIILELIPSAAALKLTTVAMHEYYGMLFDALKNR